MILFLTTVCRQLGQVLLPLSSHWFRHSPWKVWPHCKAEMTSSESFSNSSWQIQHWALIAETASFLSTPSNYMSAGTILSPLTNLLKFPEEKENIIYLQTCGKTMLDSYFIQDKLEVSIFLSWDKIRESLGRISSMHLLSRYMYTSF